MAVAKVARFYGWTHRELMEMNSYDFERYHEAMNILKAEELLFAFKAQDWPLMKRDKRSGLHKKLHAAANPKLDEVRQMATGEQMAAIVKGLMGGR